MGPGPEGEWLPYLLSGVPFYTRITFGVCAHGLNGPLRGSVVSR